MYIVLLGLLLPIVFGFESHRRMEKVRGKTQVLHEALLLVALCLPVLGLEALWFVWWVEPSSDLLVPTIFVVVEVSMLCVMFGALLRWLFDRISYNDFHPKRSRR